MSTIPASSAAGSGVGVVVIGVVAGLLVWTWSLNAGGAGTRFPAVLVSLATFLAVQLASSRMRWNTGRALGPGNIALILFALQLVVIPTMVVLSGPAAGSLVALPADRYINIGLLLQALAYVCYAVGYVGRSASVRTTRLLLTPGATTAVALAFVALGAIGLVIKFLSLGALRDYLVGAGDFFTAAGPTTIGEAASTFLRPFLSYGIIIVWTARIVRRRPGQRVSPAEFTLAALAVTASATNNYNRASAVIPIIALITAYSIFGRRLSVPKLAAVLLVLAIVGFQFGEYRAVYVGTQGGRVSASDANLQGRDQSFAHSLQVYGNGPQFWAVTAQDVQQSGLRDGGTLVGSILLPVPVLGKPFRAESGPAAYNELVYGGADVEDQILGFGAELYWNFGVPGLVIGYILFGLLVRGFDDRLQGSVDPLAAYSWSYCGIWVALLTINSISVLAQIVVYFLWPVIAMFMISRIFEPRAVEVHP